MSDLLTRYRALKNGSITSNSVGSDTQETEEVTGTPTTTSSGSSTLLTRYRNLKANTELTNTLPTVTPENRDTSWLNLPTNFLQESLGMLGGISQAAYGFGAEALGRIAHPIEKGIPGVKSDIASVGNLLGTTFEGIIDPNGPSKVFTNPIESTKEAMSALGQLRELQKEDPKRLEQAFSNVEQTYLQAEDLPLLTKMVGGIWFDTAETLTKLASQPKQTIVNEPLRTTLNLMNFGKGGLRIKPIKGLEGLFGASAKELGAEVLSKIGKENALGRTITGMQDYLKTKALKKEYSALDYKRMDEWFDYRNDLMKANFKAFEKHLTPEEKKFFPYYVKGLKTVPEDVSPELRLALLKAKEISKLSKETLIRNGILTRAQADARDFAPITFRIGYGKFGKTLDQLDDAEKTIVEATLAKEKTGLHPFYYPAIQKNRTLGFLFPSKKLSKYKPGFAKQFTGKSELFPEAFFQSPFQAYTRYQLAVNKYLFDIDTMNTTLNKFGKPIQLGDDVLPGYVVIAPEGYTALVDPTKTSADILESIMTDPNIDFNEALFGGSVEEVSSKLGLDLTDLASQTRPIRFYQVPKFVASDIQKKIAGSAFRKELRNADNFGEVMDAIWNNKTEAFLLSRKSLLGLFKKVVLGYFPLRWMKNNLMGNIVFAVMEGLNPKDFLESFKMAKGKGVYKNLREAVNPEGTLPLTIEEVATLSDDVKKYLNNVNRYKSSGSFVRSIQKVLPDQTPEQLENLYRRFKAYRPSTEAIQALPKFERAGVSLQEYQRGLSELLGIPEDKLKAFLPQGVESGLGKTEMDRVLNNFYSTEDTSSRMQKGWQVFKNGFNFIPNNTFAANTMLENFFRRASYYHAVSKLAKDVLKKTGREINPQTILDEVVSNPAMQESALKEVNQFFGDYLSKTTGDQAIPFVRFYKHVVQLALKYPMQFPGRAVLIKQLQDVQDSVDEEIRKTEVLPDYLQAANNIPIVVGGVPYRMRIASSDPFGSLDLTDVKPISFTGFEPVDTLATALLRQAAPDIKVVAERFKQYDLFRQQPFSSEEQQKYYNAKPVPDLDKHILKQIPAFSDARKLWDALWYWHKTGKFEVPARNALDEVYTDSSGNPMYTNSEWLELLKTIGINLVPEDDYQNQVENELNDLKDQQIIEDRKTIQ